MTAPAKVHRWDEIALERVTEMVSRKEIEDAGERLVQTYLKKGALVPVHAHDGPQWVYVLQGAVGITMQGQTFTVREGEALRIPAGILHQAEALDDSFVLDVRR